VPGEPEPLGLELGLVPGEPEPLGLELGLVPGEPKPLGLELGLVPGEPKSLGLELGLAPDEPEPLESELGLVPDAGLVKEEGDENGTGEGLAAGCDLLLDLLGVLCSVLTVGVGTSIVRVAPGTRIGLGTAMTCDGGAGAVRSIVVRSIVLVGCSGFGAVEAAGLAGVVIIVVGAGCGLPK
jgi:hypothetical protein